MEANKVFFLKIGPVVYEITANADVIIGDDCSNFFSTERPDGNEQTDLTMRCSLRRVEPTERINIRGQLIYQDEVRQVFNDGTLESRIVIDNNGPFAFYHEVAENEFVVETPYCFGEKKSIYLSTQLLEAFAIERHLARQNAYVLHSAFIEYKGLGIDFTAPSGTGKSTQAGLWERYEGAQTINGDRSVIWLNPLEKRFYVCGLPFCGSSEIHINKRMPLRAVVFIEQHPTNIVEPMPGVQAAGNLFVQMSINKWDRSAVTHALDFIDLLAKQVHMVHLKCNMEQDAVTTLRDFLAECDRQRGCASLG